MLQSIVDAGGKNKINSKQILLEFLNERNFRYENTNDENILIVPMSGENGNWKMLFHIIAEKDMLQIRSYCPIKIKDNQKLRISELITRLNNMFLLGYFSFDFEEGEIVFKTIHLFAETDLNLNTLNILFVTNAQTLDEYLPAITAVNSGYAEPCLAAQ